MSATTETTQVVTPADLAGALNAFADMVASGLLPQQDRPNQALEVTWFAPDADAVREVARLLDLPVVEGVGDGTAHTRVVVPLGEGIGGNAPHYSAALLVRVVHIDRVPEPVEVVDLEPDVIPADAVAVMKCVCGSVAWLQDDPSDDDRRGYQDTLEQHIECQFQDEAGL